MDRSVRFRGRPWLAAGSVSDRQPSCEWRLAASVVTSIAPAPVTTPIPGAPAFVAGLTGLDVGIVPVFRLSNAPTRMLVCEFNESPLGLLVDAVTGIGSDAQQAGPVPPAFDLEALLRAAQKAMRRLHGGQESDR